MKKQIFTAAIAVILMSLSTASAQGRVGDCPDCPRMKDRLNLSEDQLMKIQDLKTEHQKQLLDFKNSIAKNRLEMKQLLQDKTLDENKILALTDANSDIQAKMKRASVKHKFAVYNLLDDKQKEIFAENFGKMGSKNRMMKAKRGRKNIGMQGRAMRKRFRR